MEVSLFRFYIIEQYSLKPERLILNADSPASAALAADLLEGVEGLDVEALDEGLADLLADLLAGVLFEVELAGCLRLVALADGLVGVLKSFLSRLSPLGDPVKLSSFMGETEDLLLVCGFRTEAFLEDEVLAAGVRLALLVEADLAVACFLIGVGVVLAFVELDFGRGVPLIGFEVLFAGVCVALAMVLVIKNIIF